MTTQFPQINDLKIWFKADSISANDGDAIGSWTDSSGSGLVAVQGDDNKKPIFKASQQNGKPCLRFDSGKHFRVAYDAAKFPVANSLTMFAIYKPRGTGTYQAVVGQPVSNTAWPQPFMAYTLRLDNGKPTLHWSANGGLTSISADSPAAGLTYTAATRDGSTSAYKLYQSRNVVAQGNSNSGNTFASTADLWIGSNSAGTEYAPEHLDGDIYEIIIYDRVLTDSEMNEVYSYLEDKYEVVPPVISNLSTSVQQMSDMVLWYKSEGLQLNASGQVIGYTDASPAGNNGTVEIAPYGLTVPGTYTTSDGTVFNTDTPSNRHGWQLLTDCILGDDYTIIVAGRPAIGQVKYWNSHVGSASAGASGRVLGLGHDYSRHNNFLVSASSDNRVPEDVAVTPGNGDTSRIISAYSFSPHMYLHGVVKSGSNFTYRTPQTPVTSTVFPVPEIYTGWGQVALGHTASWYGEGCAAPGILELLIFNRALSQEEIEFIEGYLAYKYDSVGYLSENHPYVNVAPVGASQPSSGAGLISKENPSVARRRVMNMTMNKAELVTASEIAQGDIKRVLVVYASEGNPDVVANFEYSRESAPGRFRSEVESAASYSLSKVIIIKTDSSYKIMDRSELSSPEDMDIEVT